MVLQRRLDYGFSGHEVPVVPRASRSVRRKTPFRKAQEDNPVHAFEILANVADELLRETEISVLNAACAENQNNIIKQEKEDKGKLLSSEPLEQETCEGNTFVCVPGLPGHHQIYTVNQDASGSCLHTVAGDLPRLGELFKGYEISAGETKSEAELLVTQGTDPEKICSTTKLSCDNIRNASRAPSGKVGADFPQSGEFSRGDVDDVIERKFAVKSSIIPSTKCGTPPVKGCLDTKELHWKPTLHVTSERNSTSSLSRACKTCHLLPKCRDNMEVYNRDDDDETFARCTQPCTIVTTYRPSPNTVDQRIKNLSAFGHWRAVPKMKDWKRKPVYYNRKTCYTRRISQRISPFKRGKFNEIPLSTSDGRFHFKGIFNSPYKSRSGDNCSPVKGASSSVAGQQVPPEMKSRDCNVKLTIRSLKVPELFIEIPATATVGSLKRTVMEAMTSILGDGLHVGILLQGKAVRDDGKTLLQTGISHDDKHGRLGFMLERNHRQITPPPCTEDSPLLSGGTCQGLTGHTASLPVQLATCDVSPLPHVINSDSQAVVAVPAVSMEALAVVPFHHKPNPDEFVQRRTRRPFSVSEVEALVRAVEELGTGRWREVKFCAFDSAKHRTYVDLKDKWKTLVHTARISPQQRRGEPVPQQLLDRVLAAHAFWSQHQAKQLVKVEA